MTKIKTLLAVLIMALQAERKEKMENQKVCVGRYINGVVLNPLEYLIDDNGDTMIFENEAAAKKYLQDKGVTDEEIDDLVFELITEGSENE